MNELAEFLLARIGRDQEVAEAEREWMRERYPGEPDNDEVEPGVDKDGWVNISDGRLLADCEGRRQIVLRHLAAIGSGGDPDDVVLRLLALPYVGHADYRAEWRPPSFRWARWTAEETGHPVPAEQLERLD